MDGNGRWAESRGLPRSEGHAAGVDAVKTTVKTCVDNGIKVLSVWAFGSENWARPEKEVNFLMQLFVQVLIEEINELHQQGVRLCFTGNRAGLGSVLRENMQMAESLTVNNDQLIMNIVMNYGGKWDIVQAAKTLASQVAEGCLSLEQIDEKTFACQLSACHLPDPDLFIRTGGEKRLSNFFLWQLAYTELYFTDVYWPDFTRDEFEKALGSYGSRERRFGKTSSQLIDQNIDQLIEIKPGEKKHV